MKKNQFILLVTSMMIFFNTFLQAQTLEYPQFTVPVYRHATDQRYSDHKIIFYATTIDDKLAANLLPVKNKTYTSDSLMVSIWCELVNAGINFRVTKTDLAVAIILEEFSSTITSPTNMMGVTGYSISGKATLGLLNSNHDIYDKKTVEISEIFELKADDIIKNHFTKELSNKKAVENYTLMTRAIIKLAMECEDKYVTNWKKRPAILTSFYKPEKKYPELSFFESVNTRLVEELNKKATTDYKTLIAPYETEILAFINKEWPKGYDVKKIKMAGHYTLAYLYYLAYDSEKLKQSMDFLYENSNKFLGNRIQYNERKPLLNELEAWQKSQGEPKITPMSTAGGK
jgi:hypothetical protein